MQLTWDEIDLPGGAALRLDRRVPADAPVLLAVSGGTRATVPGDWSSGYRWLLPRLARRLPDLRFAWLRYRVKSWMDLRGPIEDVAAALDQIGARAPQARLVLLGFSMGGASSLANAGREEVAGLVGLAPWLPRQIPVEALQGKRLEVIHGSLDAGVPFVPGVHPSTSRAAVDRARAAGVDAHWHELPGGFHGWAIRPFGVTVLLPKAGAWLDATEAAVRRVIGTNPPARSV